MKSKGGWLTGLFTAVLLIFCLFLAWYVPTSAGLRFALEDTDRSLETSRGRERKQQYEYDEAAAQLPLTRQELEQVQPLADAAAAEVSALKEERRQLREEKQLLEEQAGGENAVPEGGAEHD